MAGGDQNLPGDSAANRHGNACSKIPQNDGTSPNAPASAFDHVARLKSQGKETATHGFSAGDIDDPYFLSGNGFIQRSHILWFLLFENDSQ